MEDELIKIDKQILLHPDVFDNILAEDEGVGHDGAEDEHDAGEDPDGESSHSLQQVRLRLTFFSLFCLQNSINFIL